LQKRQSVEGTLWFLVKMASESLINMARLEKEVEDATAAVEAAERRLLRAKEARQQLADRLSETALQATTAQNHLEKIQQAVKKAQAELADLHDVALAAIACASAAHATAIAAEVASDAMLKMNPVLDAAALAAWGLDAAAAAAVAAAVTNKGLHLKHLLVLQQEEEQVHNQMNALHLVLQHSHSEVLAADAEVWAAHDAIPQARDALQIAVLTFHHEEQIHLANGGS